MDRNERFEITALADKDTLCALAEEVIRDSEITIVKDPHYGMIMARAFETVNNEAFNLGEVLVTEAEVKVNGFPGYSMVIGREIEKALAGAVIDGAVEAGHPAGDRILTVLEREKLRLEDARRREWAEVSRTKADFEVMEQ